jgi:hypothetical protein
MINITYMFMLNQKEKLRAERLLCDIETLWKDIDISGSRFNKF